MSENTVYWSSFLLDQSNNLVEGTDLLALSPTSLYNYISNDEKLSRYSKCPASVKELTSTFAVPFSFNYTLKYENGQYISQEYDQDFFDSIINIPGNDMLFIKQNIILFSEKKCEVSYLPAYMHDTSLNNNYYTLTGSLDISQWFRPLHGAYSIKKNDSACLSLKRGDPLFYIKFNTGEKIRLKEFSMNKQLINYAIECTTLKKYVPFRNLNYLYNIFKNKKYSKRILKEIKNNLVE